MDKDLWVVENIFPKNNDLNTKKNTKKFLTQVEK